MYNVSLTISNVLGCTDYIVKKNAVTVFDKPTAAFTIKPDIKESENPLRLYNYSYWATNCTWDFGDGNKLYQSNRQDTAHTYKDTGNFSIALIAENTGGCEDTAIQNIRVFGKINCIVPNAFTPGNSDNLNAVFAPVCVGVSTYTMTIYNHWVKFCRSVKTVPGMEPIVELPSRQEYICTKSKCRGKATKNHWYSG